MKHSINFSAVSETLFLPLYARAVETLSKNPIINDPLSVQLTEMLDEQFSESDSSILKAMVRRKLPKRAPVSMGLRTRAFDRYIATFLVCFPDAIIINLGCGLDTRFARVDNGTARWYNIDLEPVMLLRDQLLPPREREINIPSSVLDFEWMDVISDTDRPVIIYAEGLFMYLSDTVVVDLLMKLQERFPDSELVAEVFNFKWVSRIQHPYFRWKFKRQLHMNKDALFTYGVKTSRDFEILVPGSRFLDDWNYFDEKEKKLGWYNIAGKFESVRMFQWVVHYNMGHAGGTSVIR
jgi:O-methyltransferase involved in polyketide biosynthesis